MGLEFFIPAGSVLTVLKQPEEGTITAVGCVLNTAARLVKYGSLCILNLSLSEVTIGSTDEVEIGKKVAEIPEGFRPGFQLAGQGCYYKSTGTVRAIGIDISDEGDVIARPGGSVEEYMSNMSVDALAVWTVESSMQEEPAETPVEDSEGSI